MKHVSHSAAHTVQIAAGLGKAARPGHIFCLSGDLGVGKTEFARGIAQGLGFFGTVASPTFNLLNVYEGGRLTVYHFDFYRLGHGMVDIAGIGVEDYFYLDQICVVEWPGRLHESFFAHAVWVNIAAICDNTREIIIT